MLLGKYIELGRKPYLYKQTFYRIGLFLSYYTSNSDIWLLSKILISQQRNLHMMNKSHYIMGQLMHFKCMELAKWNWWAIIEQLDSQVIYHWKPQRVKFISICCCPTIKQLNLITNKTNYIFYIIQKFNITTAPVD